MKFFPLTLMSSTTLPDSYEGSSHVTIPNALFDPVVGNRVYNEGLDRLELAEELGFDGVFVAEHHQSAYGMIPSPNILAAMLARRTSRMKIGVLGAALPLYGNPLRIAEEHAMIDVISGGRMISGLVMGGQPEYYGTNINPAEARGRFREGLDLIIEAWTRPGPFPFSGQYYQPRYVNPWPLPIQKPHPPIWIPGVGSIETIKMVAERGYTYCGVPFFKRSSVEKNYAMFRQAWLDAGREPDPNSLALLTPVYVTDRDDKVRAEYEPHVWYQIRKLMQWHSGSNAPGYMSAESTVRFVQNVGTDTMMGCQTWDDIVAGGYVIAGSPSTVAESLAERLGAVGAGNVCLFFDFGNLSHEASVRSMTLFAEEVMPALQNEFPNGPAWAEATTKAGVA